MLSIIQTGGKQYLVQPGDKIRVEKLPGEAGSKVSFSQVLFTSTGSDDYQLGKPFISGAMVNATITKQGRGKKVVVVKFKEKSRYHRKAGHRQEFTEVEIG